MQTGRIELDRHGKHTAIVRFLNPPRGFMDEGTVAGLDDALQEIAADDDLRVVVLTGGQPGVFIRHYDVGVLEERGRSLAARGLRFSTDRPVPATRLHQAMAAIEASPRIFIAAINGTAMGGGFELALACDLRIAEQGDYPIGLPETNIGLLPGAGGTQRLARTIGPARALELILRGRTLGPADAAVAGLVHSCCEGPALAQALAWADELCAQVPRALAHVKYLVRGAGHWPFEQGMAHERTLFCDLMVDPASIEAMARFNRGEAPITGVHRPAGDGQ
jgi:enoyl-CoA hydratase